MNLKQLQNRLKEEKLTLIADIQGDVYTSSLKGIAPILNPMKDNQQFFKGAIVVDKVIGKATAMLLILSDVQYIYAYILSQKAKVVLEQNHISFDYEECVDYIVNRDHTGMCPMEQTVNEIDDLSLAYTALIHKQKELMK